MAKCSEVFVGIDTGKMRHAIAVADTGRDGEVRYLGEIDSAPATVEEVIKKLGSRYEKVHVCYEAGPTGYGLYRQVRALGHACTVVAPSLIPRKPGEQVKTNRRDAVSLARLFRAGELTAVWVPDAVHEAVRDLVRARASAAADVRKKRQQLLSFLLRHGRIYSGTKHWTQAHARWLAKQSFEHPAQQIVFQDAIDAIEHCAGRLQRLDEQLQAIVPTWSMAPVVAADHAMRGVSFIVAVTFVAEIGDVRRFDSPRQVMAFLGLVPSERSTGDNVRRAGLTLSGNQRARRALVEGEWTYRYPARVSAKLQRRSEELPKRDSRHHLEGAGPPLWPVSSAGGERQEDARHHRYHRSRDSSVSVGDRPTRRSCFLTGGLRGLAMIKTNDRYRPSSEQRSRAPP